MEKEFFSVVIPLYQKEKHISRAIESVLSQSYPHYELLVIDDGSTDKGPEIVRRYADSRIRLISQANLGVSAARNRGIAEAKTDYIAFLDADDKWEPDFLREMKRLIETYPNCGWYSCSKTSLSNNGRTTSDIANIDEGVITNYFEVALKNNLVHSSSVVIPKTVFNDLGGFPAGVTKGEDTLTWIKIASVYQVCFTNQKLSWYLYDEKNMIERMYIKEPDLYSQFIEPGNFFKNEFLASVAIHKGILDSIYCDKDIAKAIAKKYNYTTLYRRQLRKLKFYNSIPSFILRTFFVLVRFLVLSKRRVIG